MSIFVKVVLFVVAVIACGRLLNKLFPAKQNQSLSDDDSPIIDVRYEDIDERDETDFNCDCEDNDDD